MAKQLQENAGASAEADRAATPAGPSPEGVSGVAGIPCADDSEAAFERLMDAHQTLIKLRAGDVLTQEMVDDLLLIDSDYRENDERCTEAFHKGYLCGLERGSNADTAKLIEERDSARGHASVANALRSGAERWAFINGAQVCREMMARFVEQGGAPIIAQSIRLNWRPSWGDDPGVPDEAKYADAAPCEISAKPESVEA